LPPEAARPPFVVLFHLGTTHFLQAGGGQSERVGWLRGDGLEEERRILGRRAFQRAGGGVTRDISSRRLLVVERLSLCIVGARGGGRARGGRRVGPPPLSH